MPAPILVFCNGRLLADKVKPADTFRARFLGLMGKKQLAEGEGLLLLHCPGIHCFFMKIPIDAVYLSEDLTVLGRETLSPRKVGRRFPGTAHVLELSAGKAGVSAGDRLTFCAQEGGVFHA